MAKPITTALRAEVGHRARFRCEYCLLHEDDAIQSHHVDHIISQKHDGETGLPNLAFACSLCNWHKGSNVATFDKYTQMLIPLFNPRTDNWESHFALDGGVIVALSRVGEATVRTLRLNEPTRVTQRARLISQGHYPRI